MKPIRILLADDHALIRNGLRSLLQTLPDLEVVGEASNGQEALEQIDALQPDIVLSDITMPVMTGLDMVEKLRASNSPVRVIILSMHASEEYVTRAVRVGANGYLLKDADLTELQLAIQTVQRGENYLTPSASQHVMTDYLRRLSGQTPEQEPLTPRQQEILRHIAVGLSTKEIARKLQISVKTVETHRAQLMDRLNIHDVASLVRYAIRKGMISADE